MNFSPLAVFCKIFFYIIHDKEICLNKFFLPHLQLLQEIQNKHVYAYIWKIDTNASMLHHQIFVDMFFTVEDLAHQSKWQLLEKLIIKYIELVFFHFSWSPYVNKEDQPHTMPPELLYPMRGH